MIIEPSLDEFSGQSELILDFLNELSLVEYSDLQQKHFFLAEAACFRLYRIYEKLIRASFLYFCVEKTSLCGVPVHSKLICPDCNTAEEILKSSNRFLDWGNVETTRNLSNLVFESGFPLVDFVSPIESSLKDLQRFRNFVAHDSKEAAVGFKKARANYVKLGDVQPETVGALALYRKTPRADITLKILHRNVTVLPGIIRSM